MRISLLLFLAITILSSCKKDMPETRQAVSTSITSVSPLQGNPGTEVTITGTNFSNTLDENVVQINGTAATVKSSTPTSLVIEVPVGAGTGLITVSTQQGSVTGPSFTYVPDIFMAGAEGKTV